MVALTILSCAAEAADNQNAAQPTSIIQQPPEPLSPEDFSRCFFVYAPIHEVGRDHNHAGLSTYGQLRLMFVVGYFKANESNSAMWSNPVFQNNWEKSKLTAEQLEKELLDALKDDDESQFDDVIKKAVACDVLLGIETKWIPKLHQ